MIAKSRFAIEIERIVAMRQLGALDMTVTPVMNALIRSFANDEKVFVQLEKVSDKGNEQIDKAVKIETENGTELLFGANRWKMINGMFVIPVFSAKEELVDCEAYAHFPLGDIASFWCGEGFYGLYLNPVSDKSLILTQTLLKKAKKEKLTSSFSSVLSDDSKVKADAIVRVTDALDSESSLNEVRIVPSSDASIADYFIYCEISNIEIEHIADCYLACLSSAVDHDCVSIVFPMPQSVTDALFKTGVGALLQKMKTYVAKMPSGKAIDIYFCCDTTDAKGVVDDAIKGKGCDDFTAMEGIYDLEKAKDRE
ncbi:MAG TPA: hypothetical protein DCW60_03110 [Sutterella sp.]|nr:hypothetical protein [Sutterella sp.]